MSRIVRRLEPNNIRPKHPPEQIFADAQTPEDLRTGESDVHEKSNRGGGWYFWRKAKHSWEEKEVIVVDPDNVAFLEIINDSVGEALVYSDILLVRCRLVKHLGLGSVWNGVVKAGP